MIIFYSKENIPYKILSFLSRSGAVVARLAHNQEVAGAIPASRNYGYVTGVVPATIHTRLDTGSNPVIATYTLIVQVDRACAF